MNLSASNTESTPVAAGLLAMIARKIVDKDIDSAVGECEAALANSPGSADLWSLLGNARFRQEQPETAIDAYKRALALAPGSVQAVSGLGTALNAVGRHQEALACHAAATEAHPAHAGLLNNLAMAQYLTGHFDEAETSIAQALALAPGLPVARYQRALLKMLHGDYKGGFEDYEARFEATGKWSRDSLVFRPNRWRGEDLRNKVIAVHSEQGFGDTFQFVRYLKPLAERNASRILLLVQKEVQPALGPLSTVVDMLVSGDQIPAFDVHVPLLSLPAALGLGSPEPVAPYAGAPDVRAAYWAQRTPRLTGPKVGLVWAGSAGHARDRERSLDLQALQNLCETPVNWISLQTGPRARDLDHVAATSMQDWTDSFADFGDTAAVISSLDLVVTVDTAVAHLAGAMGKPVWILVSAVPDWRWGLFDNRTAWYASARLFRQRELGDWQGVITDVKTKLNGVLAGVNP